MSDIRHVGSTGIWWITYDPPPIPARELDWHFRHDDYDGAPDAFDHRSGHAPSFFDAVCQIDAIEADQEDEELRFLTETGAAS